MLKSTVFCLASTACAHSFMDLNYGPIFGDSNPNQLREQNIILNPFGTPDGDFVSIPHDDYVGDLSPETAPIFSGIVSFAHLPVKQCFNLKPNAEQLEFDIAILGAPFDTAVSYRAGARFGPSGIRDASRRLGKAASFDTYHDDLNPYDDWAKVIDCGDAPMTPFDNRIALNQLYRSHRQVHNHSTTEKSPDYFKVPRIITLGGDHTTTFSALRSVYEKHGPVSVIHFDSHIDTWDPTALGGNISSYANLNHGTFLHYAHEKGYLIDDSNVHVGIRAPMIRKKKDRQHDKNCGFEIITARELDVIGIYGMANKIKDIVGDNKVYITVDIDVLDPAYAPGTGTAEPGGFTTREFLTLLDKLQGVEVVGADVVEVAPAYDTNGQITVLAAAQVVDSLLQLMVFKDE